MITVTLPDRQWEKILAFLRSRPGIRIGDEEVCRRFVEAVLWLARSGAPWRLLPGECDDWNVVHKRFARWCVFGVRQALFAHFAQDPDIEAVLLALA